MPERQRVEPAGIAETRCGQSGGMRWAFPPYACSATWIAFARNGTPDNPAIPTWPAYTAAERATMIFDTTCRIADDPDRDARLLWGRVVKD